MSIDVIVPQMGESVLEGTILEWKVKVGDKVEINQALVELMTDKVNVEIPAEASGVVTQTYATEGQVVRVGAKIATIDDGKVAPAPQPSSATKQPEMTPQQQPASVAKAAPAPAAAIKGTAAVGKGKMSPKVKMLIREYGIDASQVTPTGKDGLVTVEDVMRTVESRTSSAGFTSGPIPSPDAPASYTTPLFASSGAPSGTTQQAPLKPKVQVQIPVFAPMPEAARTTRKPLVGARKLIAEHMVKSVHTSPHVTTFEEIDLTDLVAFRKEIKDEFKKTYGANITYMPFVVKAACVALREYPTVNASITDTEIIIKNYYNIGIAVAREDGLIVPVIKNADKKTIVELAVEIASLGEKARTNKLTPDDVSDGTFTLTNAGMFGATGSTPIIAQPQVAILGIHAIVPKPWVVNGQIVIRDISNFGMSFDHRLIDGHTAVQFLHRVHEFLADGRKLLMSLR
ncbi:MAG: dihydrolipoamide acetyltransferase family protein [candidate division Zixibacteria bacterium]|nr:dihydrolipoamide acetyltransferase family protein [candidate division Zixibacteria bacterium]